MSDFPHLTKNTCQVKFLREFCRSSSQSVKKESKTWRELARGSPSCKTDQIESHERKSEFTERSCHIIVSSLGSVEMEVY